MKTEFDIQKYRLIPDKFSEKLRYINYCIITAEKQSLKHTIRELKYIRTLIREHCQIIEVTFPGNVPTGGKGILRSDGAILNYVNEKIAYYSELKEIDGEIPNKPDRKVFPALPDCFIDKNFFNEIIKHPLVKDHFSVLDNGSFQWNSSKTLLGGLATRLFDTGKLDRNIISTNQDLARVFCPFFNVRFDEKQEKQFQPDRVKIEKFYFIK